ncbi:NAD-dependent succinate-semialdehyde dehydrogenase [Candidatus Uhrbacteria bacterium]|nr:NAD-dependent succinate-semialdehyde dehydrogenase [Candidatus Uhrbacteria bacterium]
MSIRSVNPATEETLKTFVELSDDTIQSAIDRGARAFLSWSTTTLYDRRVAMERVAARLRSQKKELATLMALEMGKPVTQGMAEIEKCALTCSFYAEHAEQMLAPEVVVTDARESYVEFDPLGIILAVMPWNFPFWQVIRFAAPALMAGNVGILKHASNVPQCALALEALFLEAGFPEGVFQSLLIGSGKVETIIEDPRVCAVTLTGSEGAGSQVAAAAGRALKKTVMELGGSDPFIVLGDADLGAACTVAANARLQNNGQSCIAAKRFIVVREQYDAFVDRFKSAMQLMIVGDPLDEATNVGPLATAQIRDDLDRQVQGSIAQGARLVCGGTRMEGKGYFYAPTILADVKKGMLVYDEEVFGPVAAVIRVRDVEEAIAVANDTPYGLGASLWTRNTDEAKKIARRLEAGAVFVNGMVKSDPRLPFGGVKRSGYGRELSHYGLKEFVNVKTVWMK